ncbi:MAG: hypothetical protein DWQ42_00265 [Planctomycetota bacterium]|nr:MAG: hypothetical protein DWQ42_00265 [Planctomycetota bacterium]
MKIVDISVDGFGVWRDLELDALSDKVTVFYGPNEAGKTTLMNFIRAMLYGHATDTRRRYLPPLRGGEPGGRLVIEAAGNRYTLARHRYEDQDRVALTTDDGETTQRRLLGDLLSGCDETIFRNVYAIGLREIQELGTLSDTEAARHLYDLSVGIDRVSLPDVMRELGTAREQLLAGRDTPSRVGQLIRRRDELQLQTEHDQQQYHEFLRLADQRTQLEHSIEQAETRKQELTNAARRAELAVSLHDPWREREKVEDEIDEFRDVPTLPEDAVEKLEELNRQIEENQRDREALKDERRRLRDEAEALSINEQLWREAPRIEALGHQREWIASLETEINALDADAAKLETHAISARQGSGLEGLLSDGSFDFSPQTFERLRRPARTLRQLRERRELQEKENAQHEEEVRRLSGRIETKLARHGSTRLDEALDEAGAAAGELRRRIQIDERLEQLERHQADLEEQNHLLLERQQITPTRTLMGIGAGVVLGVLLILVGLFMPGSLVGTVGWALVLLGAACAGAAVAFKFLMEKTAVRDLQQCRQQLELVDAQREKIEAERDELDRTLPKAGGPLAVRLQAAEKKVGELEELLPLDAQRETAQQQVDGGRLQLQQLNDEYRQAKEKWSRALSALGLPTDLSPRQVKELSERGAEFGRLHDRFQQQRGAADERRRHLASCAQRVTELVRTLKLPEAGNTTLERLDHLMAALAQQQQRMSRRDELQAQARAARRKQLQHAATVDKLTTKRQRLLQRAGANSVRDYRKLALASTRKTLLLRQHETLSNEITASLVGICDEEALADQLAGRTLADLEKQWEQFTQQLEENEARLRELFQERGRLDAQSDRYRDDRQPLETRFELGCVEQDLQEATARWQELAVTSQVLTGICRRYERDQQPATLKEASRYLNQMTEGHYQRVWTPLGENRLIVDDAEGRPLSPEVLSRGTREQLFLSLRLALASLYVQRGVRLPLVLDDVLVNFDAVRAKAAAKVLREFAAAGHQVLIFTCHEHMVKMFKSLRIDTRILPDNAAVPQLAIAPVEPVKVTKPKRRRKKPEVPVEVEEVEPVEVEEPVAEEPVAEEPVIEITPPAKEPVELEGADEYDEADWEEVDDDEAEYEEDEYEDDEYEEVAYEEGDSDAAEEADEEGTEDAEYDEGEELEYEEDEYEESELEDDESADVEDDEVADLDEDEYDEWEYDEEDDDEEDDRDAEAA